MRLKNYARNHKKRKEYVQHPGLLMVGVDVSKVWNMMHICGQRLTSSAGSWVPQIRVKDLMGIFVATQVQSSVFTVQWLFAELLTVKRGFFMSRLRSLGMDNGSWLQIEPLNCEP